MQAAHVVIAGVGWACMLEMLWSALCRCAEGHPAIHLVGATCACASSVPQAGFRDGKAVAEPRGD